MRLPCTVRTINLRYHSSCFRKGNLLSISAVRKVFKHKVCDKKFSFVCMCVRSCACLPPHTHTHLLHRLVKECDCSALYATGKSIVLLDVYLLREQKKKQQQCQQRGNETQAISYYTVLRQSNRLLIVWENLNDN